MTLSDVRKEKKIRVQEIISKLGITRMTLWNLENGKRSVKVDEIISIADAYKISPKKLMDILEGKE